MSCMQTGKSVPPEIRSLTSIFENVPNNQLRVMFALFSLTDEYCQLRADFIVATEADSDTIISRAVSLAKGLDEWYANLPSKYLPSRLELEGPSPEVLSNYVYIYDNLHVASILSLFRTCLLLTHEMVFNRLSSPLRALKRAYPPASYSPLSPSQVASLQSTASAILSVIEAVCASAPYNLGFQSRESDGSSDSHLAPAVKGSPVLWPLYLSGRMDICPPETRTWIIGRLQKLGREFGIAEGLLFARFLKEEIFVRTKYMEDLLAGTAEEHVEV